MGKVPGNMTKRNHRNLQMKGRSQNLGTTMLKAKMLGYIIISVICISERSKKEKVFIHSLWGYIQRLFGRGDF